MSEPAEVEARFAPDGTTRVLSFTWRGRRLPVTGEGRQWRADDGRHFLVMTASDRIFELVFEPESGEWKAKPAPGPAVMA